MIPQALRHVKTLPSKAFPRVKIFPHDLYPVLVVAPVVVFYFINPEMFEIEWIGYATFAYASFFVVITWVIYRILTKPPNEINYKGVILFMATIFLYQLAVYGIGFSRTITEIGKGLGFYGLPARAGWLENSWLVSIDLTVFAIYLTGLTISFFGIKSLKKLSAPIVYLFLTVSAILLDAFHPSVFFTAVQMLVPYIVISVETLLPLLGINARSFFFQDQKGYMRSFIVANEPRFLALEIGWPCAGILSMLIYFALMYSLLQIWGVTKKRKLIYLAVGFIGTVLVNIFRIAALILLYSYFNADLLIFHKSVGALFFVTWITVFLFILFTVEKKRMNLMVSPKTHALKAGKLEEVTKL